MSSQLVRSADDGYGIHLPDGSVWMPPAHPISGERQSAERLIPRVCVVPAYAFSSGQEAIDLAASAGLILDPWEQLALILGLGETAKAKWASFMVALIVARQNGKGAILEALDLFWLFGTGEKLIGHTAHEYKTAMEAFRRTLFLIENSDWLRAKVKKVINTNGEEGIELKDGRRLRFLARSKGAGRGFSFPKLKWDEGYALTEEQQEAQLPTMSAMINAQLWITSSPPLTSDTGRPLFQARRRAMEGAAGITFMDYGLAGSLEKLEAVDLDDRIGWLQANPNAPERISIEAMERERVSMGDRGFARERLCIWPPDLEAGFRVITKEQWEAMLDRRSGSESWEAYPDHPVWNPALTPSQVAALTKDGPPGKLVGRPCLSVDVSPRIGGAVKGSIGLAQARNDGKRHIEFLKGGSGSAWMIADLVALVVKLNATIALDPGSPAGSLLADLETALKAADKDPEKVLIKMSARDVAQAFGMIYDAATGVLPITDQDVPVPVVHLGQDELALGVGGAETRKVGDGGQAWDRANAAVDVTPLISVTHALWGLARTPPEDDDAPMVIWA